MANGFPGGSGGKESACNAGDPGLIPGSGRSTAEGNGNPLQYSCLENSMDRGAWQATVHDARSWTRLGNEHFVFGCAGSLLLGCFSSCSEQGLLCIAQASCCSGFFCCGAQAWGHWASRVAARGLRSCGSPALEHRLSSGGQRAESLWGMWDLPGSGIKLESLALVGRFFTTEPTGKPLHPSF